VPNDPNQAPDPNEPLAVVAPPCCAAPLVGAGLVGLIAARSRRRLAVGRSLDRGETAKRRT
jgi:hypothetical protein